MRIAVINPAEWMPRIRDLLAQNWAETGFDFAFNPDVDMYQRLYDAGLLFALAAFDGDDIVGYCTVTVGDHPHNSAIRVASNDALFVKPEYRKGLVPGRLILAVTHEAKARGAVRMLWHTRAGTELASVLERHGYQPADVVVMKEI